MDSILWFIFISIFNALFMKNLVLISPNGKLSLSLSAPEFGFQTIAQM